MRSHRFAALAIGSAFLVGACASSGASPSPAAPSVAPSPSPAASPSPDASPSPASSPSAAAGATTVMVGQTSLGSILVDGEGRTLYMFASDTAGESTCYDGCAAAWPPLVVTGEVTVGTGLDASAFDTVARTDGTMQVRVGGEYPLYYFAQDAAPGDTKGQGLNDVWYVVGTDGEPIK